MFDVGVQRQRPCWIFLLASQMPDWCWYTHHCPCLAACSYMLGVATQLQRLVVVGGGGIFPFTVDQLAREPLSG